MNWLLWRQHRTQMLLTGALLALFAVALVLTGMHMAHVYDDARRGCTGAGACDLGGTLFQRNGVIVTLVHLSVALPVLLGAVGATLVAREVENATNVLVWSQTVTRRRWLLTKIGAFLGATVLVSVAVSALVTWWSGTPNALYGNRFEGVQFDTQNVLPIAFAVFAVALGIAAGSILRRTLPALAATVGIYAAVRILVTVYLRPHYMKAVTRSFALAAGPPLNRIASGSWTLRQELVDGSGHAIGGPIAVPDACRSAVDRVSADSCLGKVGYHMAVKYHPAGHYWQFQWTEAALFVALAVALVAVAIVYTLRRDA